MMQLMIQHPFGDGGLTRRRFDADGGGYTNIVTAAAASGFLCLSTTTSTTIVGLTTGGILGLDLLHQSLFLRGEIVVIDGDQEKTHTPQRAKDHKHIGRLLGDVTT